MSDPPRESWEVDTVLLEFYDEEEELARARRDHATTRDASALRLSYFKMPVRYRVDKAEILGWTDRETGAFHPWRVVGLIDVAISFPYAVQEAWRDGLSLDDPSEVGLGSITLKRVGSRIEVSSRLSGQTGVVPYETLLRACRGFSRDVRRYLLAAFPEFADHPELGSWFRGEVEHPELYLD